MPLTSSNFLRRELPAYGVQKATIFADASQHDLIDYLDLVSTYDRGERGQNSTHSELLPDGVAESQGHPLLYVVDKTHFSTDASRYEMELRRMRRNLASRGERAYLAILEPGHMSVMAIAISPDLPPLDVFTRGTTAASTFFSRLSLGEYHVEGEPQSPDYVYDEMFALLQHAADELTETHRLKRQDVLSLVGRALFFRFLCDREIVKPASLRSIAPNASSLTRCLDSSSNAASTCAWLDNTFNGDFLPLPENGSERFFEQIGTETKGAVFSHLSAILEGHEPAGGGYQMKLEVPWAKFDFAHVPVGLLSQVYEAFSWRWSPDAKGTSVHYTPRRIADYLIEEAFHALKGAHEARVLDPACGAGIFLVLAFRRLYQAKWKSTGERPDTKIIREILETQITGFDVSEPALRLAALSLYLTAIELDPDPVPPSKLRFKNLRGRVLFNFRREGLDPEVGPVSGSLGEHVDLQHDGRYDLILCNPPWTSLEPEHKALAAQFTKTSRRILINRGFPELAKLYQNPDNVPDLPFLWRATEWCRPDGRIGMVLPGRNLFKQEVIPSRAREAVFRALAVNGILNCSNLSDTNVWPGMNQPFFLLFARNSRPKANHALRFVTPHCDINLNRRGEVRVDSKSVVLVGVEATFDETWLWKALAIGTELDVEIIRKMSRARTRPLRSYWEDDLQLKCGRGYQVKGGKPVDASFLTEMPDLNTTDTFRFSVDCTQLNRFGRAVAARPRTLGIYLAPLLLVKEASGLDRSSGWALVATENVAYVRSFYGYSANGHPEGERIIKFLHLFFHSNLWNYYTLLVSPKLGVERRAVYKTVLDDCPITPWETLTASQKVEAERLSGRLLTEDLSVFGDIDDFFAGLYGLDKHDTETIRETLEMGLPYQEVRERACLYPTPEQQQAFATRLAAVLKPFVRKHNKNVEVELHQLTGNAADRAPYTVLLVGSDGGSIGLPERFFQDEVLPLANETGASRVIFETGNGIAVALLNQRRYWTQSRARLCAAEILTRHMPVFQ